MEDEKPPAYVEAADPEVQGGQRGLRRALQGRHMQMIAIGVPLTFAHDT